MRCGKCGYALWNLNQPRCPECGRAFAATDWEFEPGSVRFACVECGETLDVTSFGNDETTCPACGSEMEWGSVRVTPLRDGKGVYRRRSRCFTVSVGEGISVFIFFLAMVGLLLPALGGRPRPPEWPQYVGCLLVVVAIAAWAVALLPRKQRRIGLVLWGLVCLAVAGALSLSYYNKWCDYQHFCWRGDVCGDLHEIVRLQHEIHASRRPSRSMIVFMLEVGWLPDDILWMTQMHRSSVRLDDLAVGQWSLQELADGEVTVDDLRREAASQSVSHWQQFGDYLISSPALWDPNQPEATTDDWWSLIVAISPRSPYHDYRYVGTADGRTEAVKDNDGWIEEQNALRESLGLEPLPDLP
jgi:RNA polymerase subunit RPABC4/transcription elongation factor Spt4